MHCGIRTVAIAGAAILLLARPSVVPAQLAEPWRTPYAGKDASGPHVLGLWKFDAGHETEDSSGRKHTLQLQGATIQPQGKFGSALESAAGWPAIDRRHAAVVKNHPDLSPKGPFSLELWLKPKPELKEHRGNVHLIDKKYVAHTDYQLVLNPPAADGSRTLKAVLGFGDDSDTWYADERLNLPHDTWSHLAMTYDGAGTVRFYLDGVPIGGGAKPGRGAVAPGTHALSIGDRLGSNYAGFPGFIDEVRLTSGVREFRTVSVAAASRRQVFLRGEPTPQLIYRITNHAQTPLEDVRVTVHISGLPPHTIDVGTIESGKPYDLRLPFDTQLRPDQYDVAVQIEAQSEGQKVDSRETIPVTLVARKSPYRMPVVMWGIGGIEGVVDELPRLKEIGFTHCLGLRCDYGSIWKAKSPAAPAGSAQLDAAAKMLDTALANDLGIIVSLSPGRWLESKPELLRIDRNGDHYKRDNIANVSPEIEPFFYNVGASVANQWGAHPALQAALVDTEIRDGTYPSFHPAEREAFKKHAGYDIPDAVRQPWGVNWTQLKDIPKSRIVPDDHPVLTYYRWFWKTGDGWNGWHSALHRGFHTADDKRQGRPPLWTFFDPAVRVPSIYGSGGDVDYLSHWTYSYPDPIRIGLCTDELLTMAAGSSRESPQQVMKMTQLIWYRSQTAPVTKKANQDERPPGEDFDPDAAYITIAPMHLREALWTKLSRPIQGIMYHGWGSLVPGEKSSYRYTHPETQHELARLVKTVVEPLGPALRQIPAAQADVAMLESFASQMLARRGTYGWGRSWAGDCWHILQYAHLQPDIVYDETILEDGLDQYKVLVLPDCDVLTQSVAEKIRAFQKRGGLVVGDDRLAPGITPDIRLTAFSRKNRADEDQAALVEAAAELRRQLDAKYTRFVDADQPDVIVHRRRSGESDYIFAVNDRREFGQYVGQYKRVMEQGLPAEATLTVQRPAAHVYDLRRSRQIKVQSHDEAIQWPVALAPADGACFLVTPRPIQRLAIECAKEVAVGDPLPVSIRVTDNEDQPIDAVIPLRIEIRDPDGRPAEYSGAHAVVAGQLTLPLQIAANDVAGVWTIEVEELASGLLTRRFVRVRPSAR